jgi:hypothetical protein
VFGAEIYGGGKGSVASISSVTSPDALARGPGGNDIWRVYKLAVIRLVRPATIAFGSSNGWDAHAASAFGTRVLWCNRTISASRAAAGGVVLQDQHVRGKSLAFFADLDSMDPG